MIQYPPCKAEAERFDQGVPGRATPLDGLMNTIGFDPDGAAKRFRRRMKRMASGRIARDGGLIPGAHARSPQA